MNVLRHDADVDFSRRHNARAVRSEKKRFRTGLFHMVSDFDHIHDRNAFCDADDEINAGVTCFLDSCGRTGRRNINHGNICAGLFFCLFNGTKNRQTFPNLSGFFRIYTADKAFLAKAVVSAETSVELAGFTGHALSNNARVLVYQNAHVISPLQVLRLSSRHRRETRLR